MRPGRPFYCALLLDSELDSNLNCFWPPPRGLEPDQPWTSFLTRKPLLDFVYSIPCTNHGRMHGCHVLISVPSGKLLGFMVSHRSIKANLTKVDAIRKMNRPTGTKDDMNLTKMMAALGRFISNIGEKGLPFFNLLKKSDKFQWTDEADLTLEQLKTFLTSPPVMVPPAPKETLLLYISASTQVVSAVLVAEHLKRAISTPSSDLSTMSARSYPTARSGTRTLRSCYTLFSSHRTSCDISSSRTRSRSSPVSPLEKFYAVATPWGVSSSGRSSWANSTSSFSHGRPSSPRSSPISSLSGQRPSSLRRRRSRSTGRCTSMVP
jgi:hypothetical protein